MSHFYSFIEGNRGPATRCGTKKSGIVAAAQSWEGSITVRMGYDDTTGKNWYTVSARRGSGTGGRTIMSGDVVDLVGDGHV